MSEPTREQRENEYFISRFEEIADAAAARCTDPVVNEAYRLMFAQRDRIRQLEQAQAGATTEIQWGVRAPLGHVTKIGSDEEAQQMARMLAGDHEADGNPDALRRRTVTYGPWEPVSSPPAGTAGKDEGS
jgi:hypothetical protein